MAGMTEWQNATDASLHDISTAIDTSWVLLCTFLVFWEQAGFAMWEAGSLRAKNVHNILLKNIADAAVGGLVFYLVGYAFTLGDGTRFIGATHFGLDGIGRGGGYASFMFQWAFAATAATTVSGCVAERTEFGAYLVYATAITGFIYPVVAHWLWADQGWLCAWGPNAMFGVGMIDFAGSGAVHMLGGVAGLVGSVLAGPRTGRFDPRVDQRQFAGHSAALTALGVYCLWFGWFGFNAGYTLGMTKGRWGTAQLVCVNTVLSPSLAMLTCMAVERILRGTWDLPHILNATVAGLVGITGPCGVVTPEASIVIGILSGLVYCGSTRLHERLRIDDPVGAVAVHAWPGLWGCIAPGFFATATQIDALGYVGGSVEDAAGLFYGGNGKRLGAQLVGTLVILVWTVALSAVLFGSMHAMGRLRVSAEDEAIGMDRAKHGVVSPADIEAAAREPAVDSEPAADSEPPADPESAAQRG